MKIDDNIYGSQKQIFYTNNFQERDKNKWNRSIVMQSDISMIN